MSGVTSIGHSEQKIVAWHAFVLYFPKNWEKVYDRYHAQATGGGAYKFSDDFREKLGVCLDKLDEMDSVVSGANFLLQVSP
jgi:pantothenate kinase